MPADDAKFIVNRLLGIARKVGTPVAKDRPCKADIEIVFTAEPQSLMNQIAAQKPVLLGFHFMDQSKAIKKVTFPIQGWYVTATSNGLQIFIDNASGAPPDGSPGSLLSDGLVSELYNVLIVANIGLLGGHEVRPVSGSVARLALTRAQGVVRCTAMMYGQFYFTKVWPGVQDLRYR
ncbi:MAG: hypothetical protein ACP5QR_08275 [Rhizomicrobium sp.]